MTSFAPPRPAPAWRKAIGPAVAVVLLGLALWWLLGLDKVSDRTRQEEVEMFDLAVPPPPPPPPEVEPEKPEETQQTPSEQPQDQPIQRDPLTPPSQTTTTPPAGDLTSLLADPSADSGAFTGGPRGQGGRGNGPLIGGTGTGGGAAASRAYAEAVMLHISRHVRRSNALKGKVFDFRLRVSVSPSGAVTIRGASGFSPANLEGDLQAALQGVPAMPKAPPEGLPNIISLSISQK